jgi:hypothetical protein
MLDPVAGEDRGSCVWMANGAFGEQARAEAGEKGGLDMQLTFKDWWDSILGGKGTALSFECMYG